MTRIKRCLSIVLVLGMLLSQGVVVQATTTKLPSGIAYDDIGTKIEEFVLEHQDTTSGMTVSVFSQECTIYMNYFGYANKEAGQAVNQDTVMEWGSATKLLVWVSVMQLWEQGQIDLDRDIREYLPEEFLTNLKYDTPVTMMNLMNHNAGFQEVYADIFVKEQDAIGTLEESLKAHEPEQIYEPGTVTAYSNWGVALAAYIVERISGESFDDYVHQHIFEPLHMEHSALSADLSDNTWVQDKRKELECYTIDNILIPDCFYYITLYPTGMCTSTLSDFEAFGRALISKDSLLFQKSETREMIFTPTSYLGDSEIPSNYHGFWMIPYGVKTVGHGGNTAGCSSYLLLDLQNQIGVVVMTNQSGETVYNEEMMELVFGKFAEQNYFETSRKIPEGIYRPARTVRKGPFKLMSLSFLSGEEQADEFWMAGTSGGIEKICFPYDDCIRVPVWMFVLEITLFLLGVIAFLFSVVSLIVKLIQTIIYRWQKKKKVMPLSRWSTVASMMQVLTILVFAGMAMQALNYALYSTYAWTFIAFGIFATAMIILSIYGIIMLQKIKCTKVQKCYHWITIGLLIITVVNIGYWNLFMGWKV